ncbi:hypothetical protein C0J52_18300 [Blattella germanica]|nr:hypothetical protein C0J52_18300 [Blattella germanica]
MHDKKYNLKYNSMFYILKLKLVSTRMEYIFSFLPDGHSGIMIFQILSCLLAHHQRLTTSYIYFSSLKKSWLRQFIYC